MTRYHRLATALTLAVTLALGSSMTRAADAPPVVELWPGAVPGEEPGKIGEEKVLENKPNEKPVKRVTNVTKPTITIWRAPADKANGAAVVIAPGGGYGILAWDLEGEEVAQWLNSIGVTGVILKYRVPRRPGQLRDGQPLGALQDAQRAVSLVRARGSEWGIDPKRIGILGFSAGGHLSAWTSTNADARAYEPVDDADKASCRPDFAVLVYPAYLAEKDKDQLKPEIRVTPQTPPTFFVHAGDDRILADNSVLMYLALRRNNVPAELHVYPAGGHGFGLRPSDHPVSQWPQRCEQWMRAMKFLEAGK